MKNSEYNELIKEKADKYAHRVYSLTKKFPKEEMFGITSQLRRSALSVVLNCVEGYVRNRPGNKDKEYGQFLRISYGSLQESKYLLSFSMVEGYLSESDYKEISILADEIGARLWVMIKKLNNK